MTEAVGEVWHGRGYMVLGFGAAWVTCEFTGSQRLWSMVLGAVIFAVGTGILGWLSASQEPL